MSSKNYSTPMTQIPFKGLNGGVNTTSGSLSLQNNEARDIQNIDLDKFGSIKKRNGYTALNTSALNSGAAITGLAWYELASGTDYAVCTSGTKLYKMDGLDATWDEITGTASITSNTLCCFNVFRDTLLGTTNGAPFKWTGAGNAAAADVPTGLTIAKYIANFQNYAIYANVTVSGTAYKSRFYWSTQGDITAWDSADWIDVARDDGSEITGIKTLGDRLVIYKNRAIYVALFTGDADVPFYVQKSNSSVGCASHWSIQEVENGHVFLSYDGIYFFDGLNSYKISDRINETLNGYNDQKFETAVSMFQRNKSRYWLSFTTSGESEHDRVITWDSFNNGISIYTGMAPSSMAIFYVNGTEERPYWGDFDGFVYRGDTGTADYPLNTKTAITAYYKTNWINLDDIVHQKATPIAVIWYQGKDATLTFKYSYDLSTSDDYEQTIDTSLGGSVWDTMVWDTDSWGASGGKQSRVDLRGRGRVVSFTFYNATVDEEFQIDGVGILTNLESFV